MFDCNGSYLTGVGTCPSGWSLFGDYCYFVESTSTLYNDAEALCEAKGAKLTSIHSAEEQSYLSCKTHKLLFSNFLGGLPHPGKD